MGNLSMFLPPFASDYSGAASVFHGMGGLVVIVDPGCCTYNYVDCEESRWTSTDIGVVSAQLRSIDTVLGADESIVEQTVALVQKENPSFVLLVGTPVPALVGMDIGGIADEVQARVGTPAIGVVTTGFNWYDKGVARAYDALLALVSDDSADDCASGSSIRGQGRARVNILGVTSYDFDSADAVAYMRAALEDVMDVCVWANDCSFRDALHGMRADVNVVASSTALPLARAMRKTWGIPFLAWRPTADADGRAIEAVHACVVSGATDVRCDGLRLLNDKGSVGVGFADGWGQGKRVLVIDEQVAAHSFARALAGTGFEGEVDAASFFYDDTTARVLGTKTLGNERDVGNLLAAYRYDALVGDPLVLALPEAQNVLVREPLVHRGVSGLLYPATANREVALRTLRRGLL